MEDYVDDNEIGKVNQAQNWGNSIVIKHAEGLYSKMSHLRKQSFKVKTGDYVKQGDIIAACGNSGRSPEPHLHFQVQSTPYIGSKTFAYPLAHYAAEKDGRVEIKEFSVPLETEIVYNPVVNYSINKAFEFLPGYNLLVKAPGMQDGKWEVFTDAFNRSYIYCHNSKAAAYFEKNENIFYFKGFDGSRNSLLYFFYMACYKIFLSTDPVVIAKDLFPLHFSQYNITTWLQDFVSPFIIFSKLHYESVNKETSKDFLNSTVTIKSKQVLQFLGIKKRTRLFTIDIKDNSLTSFTFEINNKEIKAICTPKEY